MIIRSKLLTEKSTRLEAQLIYTFEVNPDASKNQVAQSIFELYGKRPLSIQTVTRPGKQTRTGKARRMVQASDRKIAYVHMSEPLSAITNAS